MLFACCMCMPIGAYVVSNAPPTTNLPAAARKVWIAVEDREEEVVVRQAVLTGG